MEKTFGDFTNLCKKSMELDPFVKERDVKGYSEEMQNEIQELIEAIQNKDIPNIKEELGDVLLDWIHTALLAEKRYGFSMKEVIEDVKEKLSRRKPYIEENRKVTMKEALDTWKEVKKLEKIKKELPEKSDS